jgi:hypothetical protein
MATKVAVKNKMERLRRAKTGFEAIRDDIPFGSFKWHVRTDVTQKDISDFLKTYVKKNFNKHDAEIALAAPDHAYPHYVAATIYWNDVLGKPLPEGWSYESALRVFREDVMKYGIIHINDKKEKIETKAPVVSPADRLKKQIDETILAQFDLLLDEWSEGKKTSFDIFGAMQKNGFKAPAAPIVIAYINRQLIERKGAINKSDAQLVEGYSHLTKKELARQVTEMEKMISDLSSFKAVTNAERKPRVKKAVTADKLVAKLNYKKNDNDFKVASIDPTKIVASSTVYLFNTKYRRLTVLTTSNKDGLSVKGSAITGFDEATSFTTALRKPLEVLPIILTQTSTQSKKVLDKLTTKRSEANGRVNAEVIILKAI